MKKLIAIFLPVLFLSHLQAASPLQPAQLTCEYVKNPLGIDVKKPRLGWTLKSNVNVQQQAAYEILVSDNEKDIRSLKGNYWNTGKVEATENIHIEYGGKALKSFTRYYWRVKVYNQENQGSGWSDVAWFETAMLFPEDWKASWISDGSKRPERDQDYYKADPMPLFRKSMSIEKRISSARLYISGLGYYEALVNGKKVGDQVLDPGFTTYAKQVLYSVYDVTPLLRQGQNVLGIMLGNGWWNPLPFKFFGRWDLRDFQQTGRPCVKAEWHIRYTDGSVQKVITDESWQTAPGPILQNNIYLGEHFDARLEKNDWLARNVSAGDSRSAVRIDGPSGELCSQIQPPIRITRIIRPVSIKQDKAGKFIVDMGQNFAGVARIKVKGAAGTKISMRFGEALFEDGSINVLTSTATQIKKGGIRGGEGAPETAWQEDSYTLKGEGVETWAPRFTFHGFRYIEITGWPGTPSLDDIEGLRMNTDLPLNGSFSCSDSMFNRLHDVIQWTFLSNVFSVQSDCPAREKMGYGADMVVSANAFMFNYDMSRFYAKAVRDFANEQRPKGGITEIAPFTGIDDKGYGDQSGPLGWQLAFPYLQKQLYLFYGDKRIIEENYAGVQKQLAFLQTQAKNNLFYWDISDHEALDPKPESFSASVFYYHHLKLAAYFAYVVGHKADEASYEKLANTVKAAIVRQYYIPGTGRFDNGTQSAQVLALWYQLSPEKEKTFEQLLKEFERHNWHVSTGIFSTQMLFDVLRDFNRNELAIRIASQPDYPGWGYMLKKGATTLWETWKDPGTVYSCNHPMFGSIDEWFYRALVGINPAAPGFKKIVIKPQPGSLKWARGTYESLYGTIRNEWKKVGDDFSMNVSIPPNTTAEIWIPSSQQQIFENKRPVTSSRYQDGYVVIEVGSGSYSYSTKKS